MQTGMGLAHLDAFALAALHHVAPESPLAQQLSASTIRNFERIQQPQTAHRIEIIKSWNIELDGARVLEIGCGQGDASVVLASAVGDGCVTAWDPASPDYGESEECGAYFRLASDSGASAS
jgi:protein-L-isoaspartate O-methyltransferase